ncbi:polysaccharide deacetylase family protein [Pelagibacterium halotolerans]|uniref:polysaccharide deacetylase family protein n=1 Tax=Pelagibacterium halotolerans TaxID=531813 RepID=UPI003850DEBA
MRKLWVVLLVPALAAGCAKAPPTGPQLTAYAQNADPLITSAITVDLVEEVADVPQSMPPHIPSGPLAGRVLSVASNAELELEPGEVVLTFDDGPRPGKTEVILDTLDAFGVRATFLMLGEAVERHPDLVRAVAQRGHTIGTHTFSHTDLATLSLSAAMGEMQSGYDAVAAALDDIGQMPSRFFRFPYLSQTGLIRASAIESDFIVLDVDVDSKDYYKDTSDDVLERTLSRLDVQGQGIVLFHDIHARTVAMLPAFLNALSARGYSVVTLRSAPSSVFDNELVTAGLPGDIEPL